MTRENFQNALRTLQEARPFRPFTIELLTGQRYEVDFANALASRDGLALFVAPGGVPVLFDHQSVSQIIGAQNTAA